MGQEILPKLRAIFGEHPKCELNYNSAFELLAAVILSAQCTDKRVNAVTEVLFTYLNNTEKPIPEKIEEIIRPCGLSRYKARYIHNLIGKQIPDTIAELMKLPGVGEKTASVFIAEFHGVPAIAVDTHVTRVSQRLGLSYQNSPSKIARDLEKITDKKDWRDFHILLVLFGRYICTAKKPQCDKCPFTSRCYIYLSIRTPI
jgi:endonuclease-3